MGNYENGYETTKVSSFNNLALYHLFSFFLRGKKCVFTRTIHENCFLTMASHVEYNDSVCLVYILWFIIPYFHKNKPGLLGKIANSMPVALYHLTGWRLEAGLWDIASESWFPFMVGQYFCTISHKLGKSQKFSTTQIPRFCFFLFNFKIMYAGFPGGAVVESLPASAGDTGSSPGPGRSHMPRSS